MFRKLIVAFLLAAASYANAALITTSKSGDLMFQYLWGEAGASIQEFGLDAGIRDTVFIIDYNRPRPPFAVVSKGYRWAGSELDFYNLSDYAGDLFAFSRNINNSPTASDLSVFTDTDGSLRLGGSVVEAVGDNDWVLHLDDAWSYRFDDDDNEMVIRVWIDQTATAPVPEPGTALLVGLGLLLVVKSWSGQKAAKLCRVSQGGTRTRLL